MRWIIGELFELLTVLDITGWLTEVAVNMKLVSVDILCLIICVAGLLDAKAVTNSSAGM